MTVLLTYRFRIWQELEIQYCRTTYVMFRGMGMQTDLYYNRLLKLVKQFFFRVRRALYNIYIVYLFISYFKLSLCCIPS